MTHTVKLLKLTLHRGGIRFWTEGRAPAKSGFTPGCRFLVVKNGQSLLLRLDPSGDRIVSSKASKTGARAPVIDINSAEELAPLAGLLLVRVMFRQGELLISAPASERRRVKRLTRLAIRLQGSKAITTAGVAAGGGVLTHALAAGLADANVATVHAFHNEVRDDLCEHAATHNEAFSPVHTQVYAMPLQELAFDEDLMGSIVEVDVVELGLPCSGASKAGRAKKIIRMPEEHPEAGHLVIGALALLVRLNPAVVLFENVPAYRTTASAALIRQHLKEMGYSLHERLLYGPDFGELEQRTRWCLVAMTEGVAFDLGTLPSPTARPRLLSEVLEPLECVENRWSTMPGLCAKQTRNREEGHNFKMQIFDGSEPGIGTLTKGLNKNRSTDPKIRHPKDPTLLRIPTPREHARCKGVPEHLVLGLCATTAHELLGQSVVYAPFRHVARHIGLALLAWSRDFPGLPGGASLEGLAVPYRKKAP